MTEDTVNIVRSFSLCGSSTAAAAEHRVDRGLPGSV